MPAEKVRLDRSSPIARSLTFPGLEYESFRVVDVDAATAAGLVAAGAGEIMEDADRILLNAEAVDTTKAEVQALRRPLGAFAGKRLHLLQFSGPIKPEWVARLEADGLRIVTYIPSNAYLVYGDATSLGKFQTRSLEAASAVQWDGTWQDRWKLAPSVLGTKENVAQIAALLRVQLVEDKEANAATLAALKAAGGYLLREPEAGLGYVNFVLQLDPAKLSVLTARPDVVSVHRHETPRKNDEAQAMVLAGSLTGNAPTPGNYFSRLSAWGFTQAQFDASNFVVDVTDDGFDNATTTPNHFVLYRNGDKTSTSRVVYRMTAGTPGADAGRGLSGHGQLNGSIVAGYVPDTSVTVGGNTTSTTTFPHADAQGFRYGLGVAPFVKLGNSTIFDPDYTNPSLSTLQSNAYAGGARVSSNSWGGTTSAGAYDSDAQTFDSLVRDAQRGVAGNQQMIVVFAAGNSGSAAGSVSSPGTSKNVICVGAAEGVRSHATAAGGVSAAGTDGCGTADTGANSANDIIAFSGRGPCDDSRIKPDIMAGGTHITGMTYVVPTSTLNGTADAGYNANGVCALSSSNFFPTANAGSPPYNQAQQWWSTSSGTSHSCPAVAGAAALVYQQFINNPAYLANNRVPAGPLAPSPALVKGYLMNSTRYMTGTGANAGLPSNAQGMGHANLGMAFDAVPRIIRDQSAADRFTASGQSRVFTGTVSDNTKPFRVTLAYTDKYGPTAGNAYINNLDLTVVVGGNTYRGNVFNTTGGLSQTGGSADARNNVECVFLAAGVTGAFTVTVTATNIAAQADPTVPGNNQDFALVVYNGTSTTGPAVEAGTPAVSGPGMLRPNDCATLSIPLSNKGNAGITGVSAVLATSTSGVTVVQPNSTYADLAAGASGANASPFQVSTTAAVPCGTLANFTLTVTYTGGGSPVVRNFSLPVGTDVSNYVFTTSTGATIPAGGTIVNSSNVDDAVFTVTAPFAFTIYGTTVAAGSNVVVSTNGNVQLRTSGGSTDPASSSLPSASFTTGATLVPNWTDLLLDTTGGGIYTNTTGVAPNRKWFIQWRGRIYTDVASTTQTINFALVLTEGVAGFEYRYVQMGDANSPNGTNSVVGVQAAPTGSLFAMFSWHEAILTDGLVVTATLPPACATGSGPCAASAPNINSAAPSGQVIVGTPYSHTFTATGSPPPTFALTAGTLPAGLTLSSAGVLSGTATSAGTGSFTGLTVTASNGTLPNSTQNFSLTAVTRSANYIASFGLTGNDALPAADLNGDGVNNLLAYALGLSPIVNNTTYEKGVIRNYGGIDYYSIRFNRSSVATDLTYIVEASSSLSGSWTELARSTAGGPMVASGGVVVSDAGGPPTFVTEVRDVVPVTPSQVTPDRFVRLRVTSP